MTDAERLCELAFGFGSAAPEDAARNSTREYVRGIDQLAEARPGATGRRLTALEALRAYGLEVLAEVGAEGYARLAPSAEAAGRVIRQRREQLGLGTRQVASRSRLSENVVLAAESYLPVPIRSFERIARALGLDERFVSVRSEPEGNERIAVRLRTIGDENPRLGRGSVSALAEAAWVALAQVRLEEELRLAVPDLKIAVNPNYGTPDFPAYEWGYLLAREIREKLGVGSNPIESMRALAEEQLGLPIIQAEVADSIAGVTIEVAQRRAIVVNLTGRNRHVYVRRATIAHELGHVLYDPPRRLNDLRVDEYDDLERPLEQMRDPVEQRANAFAVELLAPQTAALDLFRNTEEDPLGEVMDRFGISHTAARYQIWNGLERGIQLDQIQSRRRQPPPEWEARETFTIDYHPIRGVRPSRAGRFSAVVARAAEEQLLSWDTAAELLECTEEDARTAVESLRDLYPAVWAT